VVGWTSQDMPMPGMTYTLFMLGDAQMAGMMAQPEDVRKMGAPPAWTGYVAVDDVDASAAKARQDGATLYVEPQDIPNVGRFAVAGDPQGAVFALFKANDKAPPARPPVGTPGTIGWHELHTTDWEKAFAFYSGLFGWTKDHAMDMGPHGTYQIFAHEGAQAGAMFNKPPDEPMPYWLYYFAVENIDAASGRVSAGGGHILNGPMEVPGGQWIAQCKDPQGAMFALVGPKA
jgi:hypothetical protein